MANEKLIYAHEAKAKLRSVRDWFGGPPQTEQDKLAQSVAKMCIEEIDKLKPVDAVEVVRCKDCKQWQESVDGIHKWCPLLMDKATKADDFCSYGERRTDG